MNQQCKVCGEPAAGFHFGAFTCEGCKSFFGRTYNNLSSISECKNGSNCVINKKNRTACKACRLRKCLLVGMSKSGSRYGRRSNWFKIHCLLQEQTNGNQGPNQSPFGASFLPGFLPPTQTSQMIFKDKDRVSPSHEDLALQSHLLHVAMLKQERERGNKSPHPDDVALQNQLRLLAWQKERERAGHQQQQQQQQHHHHHHQQQQQQHHHQQAQQHHHQQQQQQQQQQTPGTPPRDSTPPFTYKHPSNSPMFPVNFAQKEIIPTSPSDVFRPYLPVYKRAADTPSDSGASSVDGNDHDESRSNSVSSYFKAASASSPTLSDRVEFPTRKINATVSITTTTTGYHSHHGMGLGYPPPGLVTPAASQHSPRGGDLLLVSPCPGGLAVEQHEPIDLSVRSTRSSPRPSTTPEQNDIETRRNCRGGDDDNDDDDDDNICEETTAKSKPLDLTLGVKRPAEVPLSL